MLLKVLSTVAIPLRLFTNLALIAGGIWTLLLAEWDVLLTAIAAALFAHFLLALALAPGLMFSFPAGRFLKRGNKFVAYFFLLLGGLYTYGVMTAWCVGVLLVFLSKADASSVIPTLLLSYGAATGSIEFMAQKEQEGEHELQVGSWAAAYFARLGYIVMMLMVLSGRATLIEVTVAFGTVMVVSLMLQFSAAYTGDQTPSAAATV
jgi:hypothetical protein